MHVFVLLMVAVQCLGDFLTDLQHVRSCNETFPVGLGVLNDVLVDQKLPEEAIANFECFVFCLFTKYGWMDEDGGFLVHEIKVVLEEARVADLEDILYKCTAVDFVDKCKRALAFTRCFWEKTQSLGGSKDNVDDQLLYQIVEA